MAFSPLTVDSLRAFVADAERRQAVDMSIPHMRRLMLACDVVCTLLGFPWYQKHLSQQPRTRYFRSSSELPDDGRWFYFRLVRLAESLFFLQGIPGFPERIPSWRGMPPGALVAELEGARLVAHAGIPFEFQPETGSLGNDFDVVLHWDGSDVYGELKSKVETTAISSASLLQTLERARRQLPKVGPSLVWVRVPEAWGASPVLEATCLLATTEFFRKTNRVVGVMVHWEQLDAVDGENSLFSVPLLRYASWNSDHMARESAEKLLDRLFVRTVEAISFYDFPCAQT